MSKVTKLTVTGYKSIRALEDFHLDDLNVLIGANGAGKSNFISLFRLINNIYNQNLQLFVQQQGGPDAMLHFGRDETNRIQIEAYFDHNGYKIDLIPTADNRLIFGNEISWFAGMHFPGTPQASLGSGHAESKLKAATDRYSPYVLDAIKSWRVYHFHDTSEKAAVKRKHPSNDNLGLKPDAANLAAYLLRLKKNHPQHHDRIVETIRLIAPFFDDFVHRFDEDTVELEWTQVGHPDTPLRAHMLSDGTLRFMCLATLLLQPPGHMAHTILIDEPELGLHPYAITILADLLKGAAERTQLIVSTQSVELINLLSPEDVIVADQEDGCSTFKRLAAEELKEWLDDYTLGEMWKSNLFGGRP